MSNRKKLDVPGPIVTVNKKFGREVLVAIVDGNRMFTHGFEVDYPAHMYFRTMRHGPFAVMIGTKEPVEVRIMMDGKLLAEQRLDPLPQPSTAHRPGGSEVRRQVRELVNSPQPFFISSADDNSRLMFSADPANRTADERVQLQLAPQPIEPPQGLVKVHEGDPVGISDAVFDIDPALFRRMPPAPALPAVAQEADAAVVPANVATDAPEGAVVDVPATDTTADVATGPAKVVTPTQVDETGAVAPSGYQTGAPLPQNWAPSDGLLAIGIRMVQVQTQGEPVMPPDGFEYVLFQLNTWEDHLKIRANLHSRIKLAEVTPHREVDDGREHEDYNLTSGITCGHSHGHNPRRFR
jgi:hypothetical protein